MPQRNYRKEYDTYNGKPNQKKRRAGRNKARRKMRKRLGVRALQGKDVHHKDGNTKNNAASNLSVMSRSRNRAMR